MPTAASPKYTDADLQEALRRVDSGEKKTAVSASVGIPYRTLTRYVTLHRQDTQTNLKRSGPDPCLGNDAEQHLYEWALAMQSVGCPVYACDVTQKANEIADIMGIPPLTHGWYRRFCDRHPGLVSRTSENLSRARQEPDEAIVETLYETLTNIMGKFNLTADRVFNCDETGFNPRPKVGKVLARKGSTNVWSRTIAINFHLTFVACVSASGHVVPPLLILPGQRLPISETHGALSALPLACVTGSTSGFINADIFSEWLEFFASAVPDDVERPILLLLLRAHVSVAIVDKASSLGILLVCLPANATHLFQPLDVAVFGPFKRVLKRKVKEFMIKSHRVSVSKPEAIRLDCDAWKSGMSGANSAAGFSTCGLFPLSKSAMLKRLQLFKTGGLSSSSRLYVKPDWIKYKVPIIETVLTVPEFRKTKGHKKRTTVDISGRFIDQTILAGQ